MASIAAIAALIADPARAAMLQALMAGQALTAGDQELALRVADGELQHLADAQALGGQGNQVHGVSLLFCTDCRPAGHGLEGGRRACA